MNRKFLLIPVLTLFYSCTDIQGTNHFLFHVPIESSVTVKDDDKPPPPPVLKPYYTNSNFIVDSSGELFFFQTQIQHGWICGTGLNEHTPPEYIDLRPNQIVAVPKNSLKDFVQLNILTQAPDERKVAIGLIRDSVHSEGLFNLTQILKDTSCHIRWFIRKATQEETIVMAYKKRHAFFHPDNINWDSSKTRFPSLLDISKFAPPKIED